MKPNIYVLGVGGVGSWITPSLCLLTSPQQIILVDADILEEKNLDRQLFKPEDLGRSKAEALSERYGCNHINAWFSEGLMEFNEDDWLIVCVDNHMARKAALSVCDRYGTLAIFSANEQWSSEAYYYQRDWMDTPLDPRKYYPDILTDRSNDPRSRTIGCTGEAQKETPQLVTANSLAASLAGQLFAVWHIHAPTVKKNTHHNLPFLMRVNRTGMEAQRIKDKINQETKGQTDEQRSTNRPTLGGPTSSGSVMADDVRPADAAGARGPESAEPYMSTAVDTGRSGSLERNAETAGAAAIGEY